MTQLEFALGVSENPHRDGDAHSPWHGEASLAHWGALFLEVGVKIMGGWLAEVPGSGNNGRLLTLVVMKASVFACSGGI